MLSDFLNSEAVTVEVPNEKGNASKDSSES